MEYISPTGLRIDGRRRHETRHINCKLGVNAEASGSSYFQIGQTKALCSVFGPKDPVSYSDSQHDKAIVKCSFSSAKFSKDTHSKATSPSKSDKEKSLMLSEIAECVIITDLLPESQITIAVEIIQSDGGEIAASINAMGLALIDAGVPMKDLLIACTAGIVESTPLCDINQSEICHNGAVLTVAALPKTEELVHVQLNNKISVDNAVELLEVALTGVMKIYEKALKEIKLDALEKRQRRVA